MPASHKWRMTPAFQSHEVDMAVLGGVGLLLNARQWVYYGQQAECYGRQL